MRIAAVEVANLYFRYPDDQLHQCAEGHMGARVTSLVFIKLDSGLTGVGSAYSHPEIVRVIIEDHLAPFLIGADPARIDDLWERMYSLTRWYGRKGAAVSAIGAVDIALWDLKGKLEGVPVYALLGGTSNEVEAYASGLLWQDDLSLLADEAGRHLADGFRLMKMRLGHNRRYDRDAVLQVCAALAGRGRVAVDGTHRYSVAAAEELASFLAEQNVAWFEEPFPPEDIEAYANLRKLVKIPVSAGENEFGEQGFRELFRNEAVDIAQPDASRAGGISECMRIGSLAREHGVEVITHTWSDAIALMANAHVVAALKNGVAVEVDRTGCPFMDMLLTEPPDIRGGRLYLRNQPGLGLDVNPDFLARFRLPPGGMPDGNYSDLMFGGGPYTAVAPHASA